MIPAFHAVPKRAFHEVIENGYLTPAIERLNPIVLSESCDRQLSNLLDIMEGRRVDPVAKEALGRLTSGMLSDLMEFSGGNASGMPSRDTQFGCVDFLANDIEDIFLQVGRWPDWASIMPTGFIFDSEVLIKRGAIFRKKDLAPLYWRGLQEILAGRFDNVDKAQDQIVLLLSKIKEMHDFRGDAALKKLKKKSASQPPELLWHGRLPISLAIDWIYEGETARA